MYNKKGISPLIATVLVIGFTIVLAALVIQWGGQLVDKIKGETQQTADATLACVQNVNNLEVTEATLTGSDLKVTVDNKNDIELKKIIIRVPTSLGIETVDIGGTNGVSKFGSASKSITSGTTTTDVEGTFTLSVGKEVGAIAVLDVNGQEVGCSDKEAKRIIV